MSWFVAWREVWPSHSRPVQLHNFSCLTCLPNVKLRFVESGRCRRGQACNFAHSEADLRPQPNLISTRLCAQFSAGGCRYGRRCRFAHGEVELRPIPVSEAGGEMVGSSSHLSRPGPEYLGSPAPSLMPSFAPAGPARTALQESVLLYPMPCPSFASTESVYPAEQGSWAQAGIGMAGPCQPPYSPPEPCGIGASHRISPSDPEVSWLRVHS